MAMPQRDNNIEQIHRLEGLIAYAEKQKDWDEVERLKAVYKADKTDENYLRLLDNVPVGFLLTARMTTNYRQLKTIYRQRKTHRRPEWRAICAWIETLPRAEFITGGQHGSGN